MTRWLGQRLRERLAPTLPEQATSQVPEPAELGAGDALYYTVAQNQLDEQFHAIELIDARSSTLFTIGSTILPITAGLLTTGNGGIRTSIVATGALILSFICYLLLTTFFVWSYRISKWDSRPNLIQWSEVTANRTTDELHRWLGDAYIEAFHNNKPNLERKASKIGAAVWCLAGEAASLTVAVISPFWLTW